MPKATIKGDGKAGRRGGGGDDGDRRRRGRRKKDPNKPKRGKPAYLFFTEENRQRIIKENPGASFTEVGKLMGVAWSKCKNRARFEKKAAADAARYKREMEKYVPPKNLNVGRKKKKDPNAPKGPKSAYIFFTLKHRPILVKKYPKASFLEIGHMLGNQWRGANAQFKAPFERQQVADKSRYETEMAKYRSASQNGLH